ncbi:MAG: hypothetical protein LBP35_04240 [Candidatus Ancillula trichonymphae]|nr:hypothetical protein [Candidatus Ancillula trichonymphae]
MTFLETNAGLGDQGSGIQNEPTQVLQSGTLEVRAQGFPAVGQTIYGVYTSSITNAQISSSWHLQDVNGSDVTVPTSCTSARTGNVRLN